MNKIGFHYYPDTHHFQQSDLETWLPRLTELGARWLVVNAPAERALPENFLKGLLEAQITPVLHFDLSPRVMPSPEDFQVLFQSYSRWGVKYAAFFSHPNARHAWGSASWAQTDLVERFLDVYTPLAEASLHAGLTPILPPLEPGGDYWDLYFLKATLEGLSRRGHPALLEKLVIGAEAWAGTHPLNWGAGGPERWPGAIPYFTPPDEQDQRGFRIADWYDTIARSVCRESRPIFLFGVGCPRADDAYTEKTLTMARLLAGEDIPEMEPLPGSVLGGAFWLLSAPEEHASALQAWYSPQGEALPVVEVFTQWSQPTPPRARPAPAESRPIAHYLLLPSYEWGVSDAHIEAIRPFIKNRQPTIGFSLAEASQARRVTVVGSETDYPEKALRDLRTNGAIVERVEGDGTSLASNLVKLA